MATQATSVSLLEPTAGTSVAADILFGNYDHIVEPVPVMTVHTEYGIEYGNTALGTSETPKQRDVYIHFLEMASPPATPQEMASFRKIVAADWSPEFTTCIDNSTLTQLGNRTEVC
ncbi:hypothetical protein BGX26_012510, partial [Mortierella sp. AD094]